MTLGRADRHRGDTPWQSGRRQRGSRQGTWQKVIESAAQQLEKFKEALTPRAAAALKERHKEEMNSLREDMEATWASDRADLQAQIADLQVQLTQERKWRMFYEGMVRTTENGPRDMERERREATWPSRMKIFNHVDAQASRGAAFGKGRAARSKGICARHDTLRKPRHAADGAACGPG